MIRTVPLCLLLFLGCAQQEAEAPPALDVSLLKGDAAFVRVDSFVKLGAKIAGEQSAQDAANYIKDQLSADGLPAKLVSFKDQSPAGELSFHNVVAEINAAASNYIILSCHFDTKAGVSDNFAGANDSGSGVGLLLELAKILQENWKQAPGIRFVFFDGEECKVRYAAHDGFHGSRYMAENIAEAAEQKRVIAMINLDMVGDKDLNITIPRNSTRTLVSKVFEAATNLGTRKYFELFPHNIGDDHSAFLGIGIPAINLIDFRFGSSPGLHDYWHSDEDTIDKVSPESLEIVGQVVLEMLQLLAASESEK